MDGVTYEEFANAVCEESGCWQREPPSEAGVTADLGAGWIYFLLETHFKAKRCVGRKGRIGGLCDAVGVPYQESRQTLVFLELKSRGKAAKAVKQIRKGVEKILEYDLPDDVALLGEIWHKREPKTSLHSGRYEMVEGRKVFVRHKRSK